MASEGIANGTDVGQQLEELASQLTDAVKQYKAALATGEDFLPRVNVLKLAQQVKYVAQKPEEQWLDQSVWMADMAATRLFLKWKAFDIIPPLGQGSITYEELAAKLDGEVSLIRRIAWVLVSVGTLKQIGEDRVENTSKSTVYIGGNANGTLFQVLWDEAMLPYVHLPAYYEKYGRVEPKGQTHNPFGFGFGHPEKEAWEIIAQEPQRMKDFMQSMNTLEQHLPITGFYDFGWVAEKAAAEPDRVLFVDVGGGKGQAIKAITKENSFIPLNRTVLEDRADVIEEATKLDAEDLRGAKLISHNFHTEQPIKGALIYYIRRCLHDYSDDDCANILKQLADAAAPDSRILIGEQIMENPPPPLVAQTDFCMINIAGKERTVKMFEELGARAGLKLSKVSLAQGTPVGVVELIKA